MHVCDLTRKALAIEPDNNKVCNLGICLLKQGRVDEAKVLLQSVKPAAGGENRWGSDSHLKSYERAQEMLLELEAPSSTTLITEAVAALSVDMHPREQQSLVPSFSSSVGGSSGQLRRLDGPSCVMQQELRQQPQLECSSAESAFSGPAPTLSGFCSREQEREYGQRSVRSASDRLQQPRDEHAAAASSCTSSAGDDKEVLFPALGGIFGEARLFAESGSSRMPLTYDRTNQHSDSNFSATNSVVAPLRKYRNANKPENQHTSLFSYGDFPGFHCPDQSVWSEGHYDENSPAASGAPLLIEDPFDLMTHSAATLPIARPQTGFIKIWSGRDNAYGGENAERKSSVRHPLVFPP